MCRGLEQISINNFTGVVLNIERAAARHTVRYTRTARERGKPCDALPAGNRGDRPVTAVTGRPGFCTRGFRPAENHLQISIIILIPFRWSAYADTRQSVRLSLFTTYTEPVTALHPPPSDSGRCKLRADAIGSTSCPHNFSFPVEGPFSDSQ